MTKRQLEIIEDNLRAYQANFKDIIIEKESCGKGFYVYNNEADRDAGNCVQYCYSIDYLNGWLYGAVQAVNNRMEAK